MAKVLLIAEHDGAKLNAGTAKVLACCADLGAEGVDVLVSGADGAGLDGVCAQAAALAGVSRVLKNADAQNAAPLAAILAPQIAELAAGYGYVLGPSTTFGKDLLPRVAALLGAPARVRHHEGARPAQLRAADLRRQRHPDRERAGRRAGGRHGARGLLQGGR